MNKSWILHGPQGSGKPQVARALAQRLGLTHIDADWDGRRATFKATDTLHIADDVPAWARQSRRLISVDAARVAGQKT